MNTVDKTVHVKVISTISIDAVNCINVVRVSFSHGEIFVINSAKINPCKKSTFTVFCFAGNTIQHKVISYNGRIFERESSDDCSFSIHIRHHEHLRSHRTQEK